MDFNEVFNKNLEDYKESLESIDKESVEKVIDSLVSAFNDGKKVLLFGNGGSAADAQHIAAELVCRYKVDRKGLPAIALSTNTSVITAHSNDSHFEDIFSRQVESLGKEGDVLFGLSTSGNSENVIKAFEEGKKIETLNILMTGKSGGKLKGSDLIDVSINIDSDDTARIQEIGMFIYHIICDMVEKKMFGGEE